MFKKLRFYYRFLQAVIKKEWPKVSVFSLVGFFSLVLLFIIFPLISSYFQALSAKYAKPTFVEALVGKPETFNPLFSKVESEKEINSLVFRGLTKVNSEGVVVGDLAESFKNKSDNLYEFKLKKNVYWQDGVKFTADDVVYTVETSQNPLYRSEIADNFKDVEVSKIDDYTVNFKLKETFAPFLTATTVGIIPKHIPLNNYRPVGTGEFKFISISGSSVILEGAKNKIQFKFYPNLAMAETALKLGLAQGLVAQDNTRGDLLGWKNFSTTVSTLPYRLVTLFFNTKGDIINEKSVRQALSYALSKEEIIKGPSGSKGKLALNSFPDLPAFQSVKQERYPFNPDKANTLLTNAGWVLKDGVRVKDGKELTLTLTILNDPEMVDTLEKIRKNWEKIGVKVDKRLVSGMEIKEQIIPNRTFSVLLSPQVISSDPDQYVLWHTTQAQASNISSLSSPKVDKLLEDGRKTLDQSVRNEKYSEFARILLDESPAVFLYYPNFIWIRSTKVSNVDLTEFREPIDRFRRMNSWSFRNNWI